MVIKLKCSLLIPIEFVMYLKLKTFMKIFRKTRSFSNNRKESKYYDNTNDLKVVKMKDKKCSVPIIGFAGLKLKIYTYIREGDY